MAENTTSTNPPDACHAAYTGAQCMYTQHPPQLVYMHREVLGHPAIQTDVSVPNACGFALQHAVPYPCDPGRQHAVLDPCEHGLKPAVPNACGFALQHAVPYPCDPGRQHAVLDPCELGLKPAVPNACGFALQHAVPYPCDPGRQHAVLDPCGLGHPATNAGVLVPDFCGQQRIVMNFGTLGHPPQTPVCLSRILLR